MREPQSGNGEGAAAVLTTPLSFGKCRFFSLYSDDQTATMSSLGTPIDQHSEHSKLQCSLLQLNFATQMNVIDNPAKRNKSGTTLHFYIYCLLIFASVNFVSEQWTPLNIKKDIVQIWVCVLRNIMYHSTKERKTYIVVVKIGWIYSFNQETGSKHKLLNYIDHNLLYVVYLFIFSSSLLECVCKNKCIFIFCLV